MSVDRLKRQNTIHIEPKHIGLLGLTLFFVLAISAYGSEINTGDKVYVTGQAHGTYPYSNNPAHPPSWNCEVEPGQWEVKKADRDLGIIEVNGCWINVNDVNLSIKPPKPTQTPLSTPDIWEPLLIATPES